MIGVGVYKTFTRLKHVKRFERVEYENLVGGVVAIHSAIIYSSFLLLHFHCFNQNPNCKSPKKFKALENSVNFQTIRYKIYYTPEYN